MLSYRVRDCVSRLMVLSWLLLLSSAASLSTRSTPKQYTFEEIPPTAKLAWYPCLQTYQCAMLSVPLEYSQPEGNKAAIPLIRISAEEHSPNGTYQGMVLINPGGPGNTGVDFLLEFGSGLASVIGTNFDIVSFDPRGMGRSIPSAVCSKSAASNQKVTKRAYGLYGPEEPEAYWEEYFAEAKVAGAQCAEAFGGPNGAGQHMSTPVVATDMISIVDAFAATPHGTSTAGNSSLLNYWGYSYGTFLGQTFATMYPDRVGRFVFDGTVDPEDYTSGQLLTNTINLDAAMEAFFTYCHLAGPKLCAFYTGTTISDIAARFENLFTNLNPTSAVAGNSNNATIIFEALSIIKNTIRNEATAPISGFPPLAQQFVAWESWLKNVTYDGLIAASEIGVDNTVVPGTLAQLPEWQTAVLCTDGPNMYNKTYQSMKSHIEAIEAQSFVGDEIWAGYLVNCTGWPIKAKWRYSGPFGAKTKNPILFVGNTIDPNTPIQNAIKWAPKYSGSQILTIEAVGHSSLAASNTCAYSKIRHFFQMGKMPGPGTVCKSEAGAFGLTIDVSSASLYR